MSIRTYAVNCNDAWLNTEGDDITGSYVKYKDHQEVVAALEAKCAALAADNAALKAFGGKLGDMHNDLNGEGTGIQGRAEVAIQQVALQAAIEEFDAINTPDTDAFLAEVRASAVDGAVGTIMVHMNHQHVAVAEALHILRTHAAQIRQEADQ